MEMICAMNPKASARLASNAMQALETALHAAGGGQPADQTLFRLYRENRHWGSRDRRFISHLVFSFFRWRGWLRALEMKEAAAYAYSLDSNQPHDAQTALAGCGMPAWGGLTVAEKMKALAAAIGKGLAMEMLVPEWFAETLPADRMTGLSTLIESFQTRPPTWLRARTGHADEVFAALEEYGALPRNHPAVTGAIACEGGVNFPAMRKSTGPVFEVQDIASQAVGLSCAPKPGEHWWDVCAGSGGKSLHLADLMRDSGEIVATDVRASALEQLKSRLRDSGLRIIRPLEAGSRPDGQFDGVLVDAPCSGIGTWPRNPDMRWRTDAGDIGRLAKLQVEIMANAADSVKPGGTLVYSVCTVTEAETARIIEAFLASRTDFEPSVFASPLAVLRPPSSVLPILPADGPGDGMFVAKFRRKS